MSSCSIAIHGRGSIIDSDLEKRLQALEERTEFKADKANKNTAPLVRLTSQ
jgi:hypothetical protein